MRVQPLSPLSFKKNATGLGLLWRVPAEEVVRVVPVVFFKKNAAGRGLLWRVPAEEVVRVLPVVFFKKNAAGGSSGLRQALDGTIKVGTVIADIDVNS